MTISSNKIRNNIRDMHKYYWPSTVGIWICNVTNDEPIKYTYFITKTKKKNNRDDKQNVNHQL